MNCPCGHEWDDHIAWRDRTKGWCIAGGCDCRAVEPSPDEPATLFPTPTPQETP